MDGVGDDQTDLVDGGPEADLAFRPGRRRDYRRRGGAMEGLGRSVSGEVVPARMRPAAKKEPGRPARSPSGRKEVIMNDGNPKSATAVHRAANRLLTHGPETLEGAALAGALDDAERLAEWIDALREHAKARLTAGEAVPGWHLRMNASTREVTDATAAYVRAGIAHEAFLGACKVQVAKLEKAVAATLRGAATAATAPLELARRLGDALTEKARAPSLAREARA